MQNLRASHFGLLTLTICLTTVSASLFSVRLLGFLSTAPSAMAAASNFALIVVVLTPLAIFIAIVQGLVGARKKLRVMDAAANTVVLSLVILTWYYSFIAFFYNWPSSLLRTIPESFENRGLSLGMSLGFSLFSIVIWVGWITLVRSTSEEQVHKAL